MLRNFWPEENITVWETELFPNGSDKQGFETPSNMITLSKDVHALWNKEAFALKPISVSDDNTTLTIQFFWQIEHHLVMPTTSLLTTPLSTKGLDNYNRSRLLDYRQTEYLSLIKSGDLFKLTTDDPEARPLPSIALLEMQWFLQRVMGMAGAADVEEGFEDEFSDGEISNLGLDEGGDESFESNVAGLSSPVVPPYNTNLIPSIEAPKHYTEEMEGRVGEGWGGIGHVA